MKVFNKFLWMEDMREVYGQADHKAFCRMVMQERQHWANICHGMTAEEMKSKGLQFEEKWFGNADFLTVKRGEKHEKA